MGGVRYKCELNISLQHRVALHILSYSIIGDFFIIFDGGKMRIENLQKIAVVANKPSDQAIKDFQKKLSQLCKRIELNDKTNLIQSCKNNN
jgi:hypothetical protein